MMKNFIFTAALIIGIANLAAKDAINIKQELICKAPYACDAILRRDPLFIDDFLTLHSLLRMAHPASVFEIGTCTGEGTLIIKNAVGEAVVYSLDLPPGGSSYNLEEIGACCHLPYVQIIGDSFLINYQDYYPIDAWFIDGDHNYTHVFYETSQALLSSPGLIVWHDADIPEVFQGIKDALDVSDYILFRVINTRIAFAIPFTSNLQDIFYD